MKLSYLVVGEDLDQSYRQHREIVISLHGGGPKSYIYIGLGPSRCYLMVISVMELSFTDRNLKMREKTQRFF